jgi:hypothetical protein
MWDMKGVFKDEKENLIRLVNLAAGSNQQSKHSVSKEACVL